MKKYNELTLKFLVFVDGKMIKYKKQETQEKVTKLTSCQAKRQRHWYLI